MVKISDEPHHYFHHFLGVFEHLGLVKQRTLKKQGTLNNAVIPCSTNNVHIYSIFDALMPGTRDVATNSAMKNYTQYLHIARQVFNVKYKADVVYKYLAAFIFENGPMPTP